MEGFHIDFLPQSIHRGIRFILKNSFLHALPGSASVGEGSRSSCRRTLSAPPVIADAHLATCPIRTLMVRNIPTKMCQRSFLQRVSQTFDVSLIDFFYLPLDFKSGKSLGYAFVNLVTSVALVEFKTQFSGLKLCSGSAKALAISPAKIQGLERNYNLFKTSSVMTYAPTEYRPMIKCRSCGFLRALSGESVACQCLTNDGI